MKSKFMKIFFIVLCMFIGLAFGCAPEGKKSNGAESADRETLLLKASDTSFESIDKLLGDNEKITRISWSSDKKNAAFAVEDMDIYIWKVGESEPVEIKDVGDVISSFSWSPDNAYVMADIGTSINREGYIVDVKKQALSDQLGYVGSALLSPDSNWIALGQESDIRPSVELELTGTVDLNLYNIETKERKLVAKGTADYYFAPEIWDSSDVLIYVKREFKNPDEPEVLTFEMDNQ